MRISTTQIFQGSLNSILDNQSGLIKTQLQLSTGRRILTPSDDPTGSARVLDLNQAIQNTTQYQKNADSARARLELEESTLGNVGDLLQRIRELTLQANNDSQTNQTRRSTAFELREILGHLLDFANTRDSGGEYLYAGSRGNSQPFSRTAGNQFIYNGDQTGRAVQIGLGQQIAAGDPGNDVFVAIRNGNGTFTTLDNPANTGNSTIDPGAVTNPGAVVPDTYSLILGQQTAVTGGAIGLTDSVTNDTLQYELRINGTLVYTANEGDTRTQVQLAADIAAQSGTTGVTAYVHSGVLYLANTTPSGLPISVNETLTGATEDTDTVTGYFGSVLTGLTTPSATQTYNAAATGYVVLDSASAVVTAGSYQDGGAIAFNGWQTRVGGTPNNGDRFTISPSVNQDLFATVQSIISTLENSSGVIAQQAQFHNAVNRGLTDLDQALSNILEIRARAGARLNTIDGQKDANEAFLLQVQQTLSEVQDLDYAEAASRLNRQTLSLEAAQQTFVKVQGLSLFNFLR